MLRGPKNNTGRQRFANRGGKNREFYADLARRGLVGQRKDKGKGKGKGDKEKGTGSASSHSWGSGSGGGGSRGGPGGSSIAA